MKNNNNFEMRIYEFLGVNIFRKYILFTWEKIAKLIKFGDTGYRINSFKIEELNTYKTKMIGFARIHLQLLIHIPFQIIIFSLPLLPAIFMIFLNLYCIMTQRYNYIRIKQVIEKIIPKIKKQIEQIDSSIISHEYVITDIFGKETEISFEALIERATPEQLVELRKYLLQFSEINNPPPSGNIPEGIIYQQPSKLTHGKRRVLTLRFTQNNNSANS